jgi:iron-sulfur cluster assembly protein
MITITDSALTKLNAIQEDGKALRVAVVGGGCSGMSYKLSWVSLGETTVTDKVIPFVGVTIVIDPKSALYLNGMELDHTDGLDGVGFTFNNPNAKRSCGCGSSFSV